MKTIQQAIDDLFEELEQIGTEHEELTDTDVRELLHVVLSYYFIWEKKTLGLPITYEMFTPQGDAMVSAAVARFLEAVELSSDASRIPAGQIRHEMLQRRDGKTGRGTRYVEFIGLRDTPLAPALPPEAMFEIGTYDEED